jgi:hypothetical protein
MNAGSHMRACESSYTTMSRLVVGSPGVQRLPSTATRPPDTRRFHSCLPKRCPLAKGIDVGILVIEVATAT